MKLALPDVTAVVVDRVAHDLARLAMSDSTEQIEFGSALFVYEYVASYDDVLWYEVPGALATSHALIMQYDGWVLDASLWRPEWLNYDYIGAPWPWHRDRRVGNGGFSLRSVRLMKFLAKYRSEFPARAPEDDTLCRVYRPALELHGFVWAPESVAQEFSFERSRPRSTFGFHGLFNFPHVLNPVALAKRIELASDYVRAKPEWKEMTSLVPQIERN